MSHARYYVKEEVRNNKNRHRFRQIAREVCGEVFDVPEDNRVLFAYQKHHGKETLIGEISFQLANEKLTSPGVPFVSEYFHQVTFMFVKYDFQGIGIGRRLVSKALKIMTEKSARPIRVQSAEKAVGFFEKMDFVCQCEPIESLCGVNLFRFMYNMERPLGKP
ncbi:uncharacterized protein LOC110466682 [Mizuhopecten yessoensis]|uniref:uncharacterized protein LOC110466682 n=1 Tax=Mizuhopecten yessoensis TaxID=6573 RepID=UPI000B45A297|nr:uncharacterized protein LOC110466682 [Mizuhopecten yessoensis]